MRHSSPPSVLRCMAALAVVRLHLRVRGFGRTIAAARRWGADVRSAGVNERALIDRAVAALVTAAAFFPGRAICLEQSLALYVLLRRRGIPVELRLGVQPFPFNAHAWLELRGVPIEENADFVDYLLPFPEIPA
ncbi:MAG TPA: lasso peptide biosynthesis B2 protein [Longimicrobiaceae bacterium]|nr:lasso peptide biosynthesis B2 protein [Longimicrobiaceae bacterium]